MTIKLVDPSPLSQSELARLLGVSRGQVHVWHSRAARNGFPAPVRWERRLGRDMPLYDPRAVRAWHRAYVPGKGGRPVKKPQVKA